MPDLELIPINEDDFKKMALPVDFDRSRVKNRVEDVQYGSLPEQKLDLYLPEKAEGPLPLIIYVHGGGWTLGTKTMGALDCIIDAVDYGYAVMSVDYRLAPAVSFPEYIFDVKTAVRWARAHAEQYGLDKDRFAMIGDSAGGHITLTVGFTAGRPEYEGAEYGWAEESSAVQVICDMYGPAVLWADADKWYSETKVHRMKTLTPPGEPEPPTMEELAFGGANKNLLKLISPISLVHKDIPPTMIQQGAEDSVVHYYNSTLLAERIEQVCGPERVHLVLYPDRNHSDKGFMTKENCLEVLAFFDKYLK